MGASGEPITLTIAFGERDGVVPCGEGTFASTDCQGNATKLVCRP